MGEEPRKEKFAWASIAGADPEPVEVVERDGRMGILTCGCGDPFWLDDETANVVLYATPLYRPDNFLTQEQKDARHAEYLARREAKHSWRGPR